MKMKMVTAKEKFDLAVWYVLDGIERDRLPSPSKKVIDYMVDVNIISLNESQFYEVKRFLEKERVLKEVGEPYEYESDGRGTPDHRFFLIFHFKILKKFHEYYRKYTCLINGGIDIEKTFGFEDETFWLNIADGSRATINFSPKGNRRYPIQPYYLLRAFIQSMKLGNLERKGEWIETSLTVDQIRSEITKLNYQKPDDLTSTWVTNARNNLNNKSIPDNLQKLMQLSHFDSKLGTYTFSLRIPS